ncbi:hypothetical protein ACFT2C_02490 [Promicromonospora sp. NPDC057138]|uniref:hypothetical protein n=1 Tax=Promicromonospora sp. NPDC057138 TaxID=3346031 RepID=UPI003641B305
MTSAKEILSTTATEEIVSGVVDLITVNNYDRTVGAMLVASDDSHRLMMEDLRAGPVTHVWAWTPSVGSEIGETEFTTDEEAARAAVRDWLAQAPQVRREPGRDIYAMLLTEEDWR